MKDCLHHLFDWNFRRHTDFTTSTPYVRKESFGRTFLPYISTIEPDATNVCMLRKKGYSLDGNVAKGRVSVVCIIDSPRPWII